MKNVLIACEESQTVCKAFRNAGINAFSCDVLDCSGGCPQFHIKKNVLDIINGGCFSTCDGLDYFVKKWDLIIAHPPCTYLTITGNRWFNEEKYGEKAKERKIKREKALCFFLKIMEADCDRIAIENPIGVVSSRIRKPDQILQPWMFGHKTRKPLCLWLKGLPLLNPTEIVKPDIIKYKNGKGTDTTWHMNTINLPADERRKERSKTFEGFAKAMANQWGAIL